MNLEELIINTLHQHLLRYQKYHKEREKLAKEKGCKTYIPVHALIYCSQKYYFEQIFKERLATLTLTQPILIIGELIHQGIYQLFQGRAEIEPLLYKVIEVGEEKYLLTGTPDLLLHTPQGDIIVDIKFSLTGEVRDHYKLQIAYYKFLANTTQGYLLILSPKGIKIVPVAEEITEPRIKTEISKLLDNTEHPKYEWECQYCLFKNLCPYAPTQFQTPSSPPSQPPSPS